MDNPFRRGLNFAIAYSKWAKAGKPLRTDEQIFKLYDDYCSKCPLDAFIKKGPDRGICDKCGCHIKRVSASEDKVNMLAWPTEGCKDGVFPPDVEQPNKP